jgi:hypothetical protein
MPKFKIERAEKGDTFARVALCGVSKSGKSLVALIMALGYNPLLDADGNTRDPFAVETVEPQIGKALGPKVGVICSEDGEIKKYADLFDFDVAVLQRGGHPEEYVDAIKSFGEQGYIPLIFDSMTHEWQGMNGVLAVVERRALSKYKKDTHRAWKDGNDLHNDFISAIKQYPGHVIATVRAKTKYERREVEKNGKMKTEIVKLGLGPIQRGEIDYEFDTFFMVDSDHNINTHGESRIPTLADKDFSKAEAIDIAGLILNWYGDPNV